MSTLKGYLLYEPEDAKKNTGFIDMFLKEAQRCNVTLSLLLTTDSRLHAKSQTSAHTDASCSWQIDMEKLAYPDFIINRSRIPALSKALEQCGIHVFNNSKVCEICNDKEQTYSYLKEYGIPFMDFCQIARNQDDTEAQTAADSSFFALYTKKARQFGYPFVLKPVGGHGGMHVVFIENKEHLYNELLSIRNDYGYIPKLIFQRCASDVGKDLRVYVLNGKIIAGMMRTGANCDSKQSRCEDSSGIHEIRANFSLGGTASIHPLTEEETALTIKISAALPADLVGIDFIYHNGHAVFNEIEDVVGTRMLYSCTSIDIVKEYMNHIIRIMSAS